MCVCVCVCVCVRVCVIQEGFDPALHASKQECVCVYVSMYQR